MYIDLDKFGEPDIKCAGLRLWVHGYQYQDVDDYWDGNWLRATANCTANGASVLISGAFIRNTEIHDWQSSVTALGEALQGEAGLECMEPELAVVLRATSLGKIQMNVDITPDHLSQKHTFTFEIDQSYLPDLLSGCAKVLQRFPIRGAL